jgi:hypothetical protein
MAAATAAPWFHFLPLTNMVLLLLLLLRMLLFGLTGIRSGFLSMSFTTTSTAALDDDVKAVAALAALPGDHFWVMLLQVFEVGDRRLLGRVRDGEGC